MTFCWRRTKPPMEASDLEKVPAMMSTSSVMPKWAAVPSPLGPEHAERVGVVDGQGGAVLPGQRGEAGHVGDVAFHGVDAIDDDHRRRGRRAASGASLRSSWARSPWLKRLVVP